MAPAAIVLQEHPGSTIVTDSVTSNGLAEFIAALGGRHHRFKRGYKNVINEGIKLNAKGEECHLAIETSGHGAMKENYFLDDGAYLVVKVLIQLARLNPPGASKRTSIRSLFAKCASRRARARRSRGTRLTLEALMRSLTLCLAPRRLREPVEDEEFRFKITAPEFAPAGQRAIDNLTRAVESTPGWSLVPNNFGTPAGATVAGWLNRGVADTERCAAAARRLPTRCPEGVRVACDAEHGDGWFLLRLSLHDPVLPLNVQSDRAGGVATIVRQLLVALKDTPDIDTTPLTKYLETKAA